MLLYYITDRAQFPGSEPARRDRLLEKIAEAARRGIDFIQLREKDLSARDLEKVTLEAVRVIQENSPAGKLEARTRLLINSRMDIAVSCGADGVHLRTGDLSPRDVREGWLRRSTSNGKASLTGPPTVAASCHTLTEILQAKEQAADLAVFGPIFEKPGVPKSRPLGLALLQQACAWEFPVLALGGIDLDSARLCVSAGAAGIAAIRLFQENEIAEVVRQLAG
jgi:thiamine-phosphate pyrophosphorylase